MERYDFMKYYIEWISQYPLIDTQREAELAPYAREGPGPERHELIHSNLRLVVKIAHDFKGLGLPFLDLISEGNMGLMRAVEKFDPSKGAKLSSYAAWWIKQSMRRALANQSRHIRIPCQEAGKMNRLKEARIRLEGELGREPTDSELEDDLDYTDRELKVAKQAASIGVIPLDALMPDTGGKNKIYKDIIPEEYPFPSEIVMRREDKKRVLNLLDRLDERERYIITARFGLNGERPKTLEQVSMGIGRTRERARQIQNQVLAKLKDYMEEDDSRDVVS